MADPSLPDPSMTGGAFINPAYATPNQKAMLYAYANELMKPQPIHNGWQGLASIANALVGGYMGHQADVQEQGSAAQNMNMAVPQTAPQQPIGDTSQGGEPAPSAALTPPSHPAPLGVMLNNPGDLRDGEFASSQPGYVGAKNGFAAFDTPQHGMGASDANLAAYGEMGLDTPQAIAARWAPKGDGNNNPDAYAANVAGELGIKPTDPINMGDPASRAALAHAMFKQEGTAQGPFAQHPVQVASNGPMAYAPPSGPASTPPAVAATGQPGSPVPPPGAPPTGVAMPPRAQVAQNGAPLYSPQQLGYMIGSPNASPQMREMAMHLIQPQMMGDINGNVSAVSPNVAPGQPPVFHGGRMFEPSNIGGIGIATGVSPQGTPFTASPNGISPIGSTGAGGGADLSSLVKPGSPTGDLLAAQRANEAARVAATSAGSSSADAWGKDMTGAMNFQRQALPLQKAIPALERLGQQGTGPGSETWNEVMSFLNTAGIPGLDTSKIKDFDEAKKYLVQYATDTGSTGTNDKLAATFSGNPNMGVNNAAAVDVAKTALAMQRFKQAQVMSFGGEKDPATGAPLSKDQYLDYATKFQSTHDPRAYGVDLMSPAAKKSLHDELRSDPVARARFNASAKNAIDLGMVAGPQ